MKKLAFLGVVCALALGSQISRADEAPGAPSCRVQGRYGGFLVIGWTSWRKVEADTLEECAAEAEALLGKRVSIPLLTRDLTTSSIPASITRGKFKFTSGDRVTEGSVKAR